MSSAEFEKILDPETEVSRAHVAGRREFAEQLLHMFTALGGKPRAVYDQLHAVCTAEVDGTEAPKHKREMRAEPPTGQTPDRVGVAPVEKEPRTGEDRPEKLGDDAARAEEVQAEADARADIEEEEEDPSEVA